MVTHGIISYIADTTPLLSQAGYIASDFTPSIGTKEAWRVQPPSSEISVIDRDINVDR